MHSSLPVGASAALAAAGSAEAWNVGPTMIWPYTCLGVERSSEERTRAASSSRAVRARASAALVGLSGSGASRGTNRDPLPPTLLVPHESIALSWWWLVACE